MAKWLAPLICLVMLAPAWAFGAVRFLDSRLAVLVDPEGSLTINRVSAPGLAAWFKAPEDGVYELPGEPGKLWLRLSLAAPAGAEASGLTRILEVTSPEMDSVELFLPDERKKGRFMVAPGDRSGRSSEISIPFANFAFRLAPPPGREIVYYLRIGTFGSGKTSLKLWEPRAFTIHAMHNYLAFGLIYGAMLCMVLYNLFIYFSLRYRIYLSYVCYMLTMLAYFLFFTGHALTLVSVSPEVSQSLEWVLLGVSIFFSILFCQHFLNTAANIPHWNRVLGFFQAVGLAVSLAGLLGQKTMAAALSYFAGGCGPLFILAIAAIRWRQGFGPARYYLLATMFFIASTMSYVLWSMGVFKSQLPMTMLFTLGPALEAIFLSFALADRIRLLESERRILSKTQAKYKIASETDGLTGLFNKRFLLERLAVEASRANLGGGPLSFLILDVDNFKKFNDSHGHHAGDEVLKALAGVIRAEVRDRDAGCRYGGEEFAVIFPNATLDQAAGPAERIRAGLAAKVFEPRPGIAVTATCSLGLAQLEGGETPESLVQRADAALYHAKSLGKNQVVKAREGEA